MRHHHATTTTKQSRKRERGASLVEYALLLALIAVVTFGAVSYFGGQNKGGFGRSAKCIEVAYDGTLGSECPEVP
jgi:Flp pilus assembly pilin Flp